MDKNTIPISDKNRREMSTERDFTANVPVKMRYCILSSPRSGSTLLGRMLFETRMAGDPQEYFNPPLLLVERERVNNPNLSLNEFLKSMENRRTSPNGVFGMKLHYSQMLGAFKARKPDQRMVKWLNKFDRLIWIRRRDKLRQGISQAIGQRSQVWSSEDKRAVTTQGLSLHPYDCLKAMQMVAGDDRGWELLITAAGLVPHVVWYEDLADHYEKESQQVIRHLQIGDENFKIPPPPIQRQATSYNEELYQELKSYLGWSEASR